MRGHHPASAARRGFAALTGHAVADTAASDPVRGVHQPVRTYAARRGRVGSLNRMRLSTLRAAWDVPPGALEPHTAFGRRAPLVLEVGCGHGEAAIAYAVSHPDHDVLALDVYPPGLARMLAAADAADLRNLRIVEADAVAFLGERVGPAQLDAVHLFFPDPWPKSKHAKRRFVGAHTLDLLRTRLSRQGHVLIATDQAAYAAYVRRQVDDHGSFAARAIDRPAWRPRAGFESKALAAGRPVTELLVERRHTWGH